MKTFYSIVIAFFTILIAIIILTSCAILKPDCPGGPVTEKQIQRHDRKAFKAKVPVQQYWKQRGDGYWVHYRKEGFKEQTAYAFECKLNDDQLKRFYDSVSVN